MEFRDTGQANISKYYKRLIGKDPQGKVTARLQMSDRDAPGVLILSDDRGDTTLKVSVGRDIGWKNGPGYRFRTGSDPNGWPVGAIVAYFAKIVLPSGELFPVAISRGMSYLVEITELTDDPVPDAKARCFHAHESKVID